LKTWIVCTGEDTQAACATGLSPVYLFYRLNDRGLLYRDGTPGCPGGMMGIYACDDRVQDFRAAAANIMAECIRRRFEAVLLDFPSDQRPLAKALSGKIKVFSTSEQPPEGTVPVFPSALSGGRFSDMLEDVGMGRGPENICIEIVKRRFIFSMPMKDPEGEPVTERELAELMKTHGGNAFLSPDLCCKYFTWRDGDSLRCAFFDDDESIDLMLEKCKEAGIGHAMVLYPDRFEKRS